jgi:glycerol-3-phosphate acyltransferase PlsY
VETTWLVYLLVGIASYLLGSVNIAVLVARSQGVDILKEGSGNPGATNVKRVLGRWWGNLVFIGDFCKGLIGAGFPVWLGLGATPEIDAWLGVIGMLGTLLGHCCSVFIGFRGGKGVASTIGGLTSLMPLVVVIALPIWIATYYIGRMVSLASILFVLALPLLSWLLGKPLPYCVLCLLIMVLVVVRHRSNIVRIIRGEENRFDRKRKL